MAYRVKRKKESLTVGLIVSLIAHALMIGAVLMVHLGGGGSGGNGSEAKNEAKIENGQEKDESEIIPKDKKDLTPVEMVEKEEGLTKKKPTPKHAKDDCPDYFGGIGVQYSSVEPGLIIDVPYGYPAEEAGIKAGDKIIAPQLGQIRGEVGTEVTITYLRSDSEHTVTLIRDKICIDKKTERAYP